MSTEANDKIMPKQVSSNWQMILKDLGVHPFVTKKFTSEKPVWYYNIISSIT